jgi:hypothetical protein
MSLVWALFILEPEICQNYFNIVEHDEQFKPRVIEANGYWPVDPEEYVLRDLTNTDNVIHTPSATDRHDRLDRVHLFNDVNRLYDKQSSSDPFADFGIEDFSSMGYDVFVPPTY